MPIEMTAARTMHAAPARQLLSTKRLAIGPGPLLRHYLQVAPTKPRTCPPPEMADQRSPCSCILGFRTDLGLGKIWLVGKGGEGRRRSRRLHLHKARARD